MAVCNLCPRECGKSRGNGSVGYCGMGNDIYASKAMLHMWEEPPISGTKGSGAVFFTGCHLKCVYCQNSSIAFKSAGKSLTPGELSEVFIRLQERGAHNINLVTPTHFVPGIIKALDISKQTGLKIPVVYNTGGYEKRSTVELLDDYVDIYLPDFKYMNSDTAQKYSNAPDYPQMAKESLEEMVRQQPNSVFNDDSIMQRGVVVRHLLLPGNLKNSKSVIEYLYKTYGDSIYISIMNQYTPMREFDKFPELSCTPSRREYEKLVDYALSLGVKNAFIQDEGVSSGVYIPKFDMEGLN